MTQKRKNSLFAVLIAIVLTATAVISCNKDNQETTKKPLFESQKLDSCKNDEEYLLSFKKKLQNATKEDETISVEQAERDLGNLLNFDFGDANYMTNLFQHDTLYFTLELTHDQVDYMHLAETYDKAYKTILSKYKEINLPQKSVQSIICTFDRVNKNREEIIVQLILNTRGLNTETLKLGFDTTDNWHVGELLGKCDGSCVGDDHTTIIQEVYMNSKAYDCSGGRLYFTNIAQNYFSADEFYEEDPDIYYNGGWRLWYGTNDEVVNYCITYPEMQYYYDNFVQIINNEIPIPQGHVVFYVECGIDSIVSIPSYVCLFYCCYLTGKRNCTNEPLPN